jgi:uncharacterized protein (TIGR02466 family)
MNEIAEIPMFLSSCFITYAKDIDNKKIINAIEELEITQPSNKRSNAGGFQSFTIPRPEYDNTEVAKLFETLIIPLVKQISKDTKYPDTMDNLRYWYNVNYKYNYNTPHTHPKAYLSGVYYMKVPKNSGNLVFNRSENEIDRMSFIIDKCISQGSAPDNIRINTEHWVIPEENKLIIFPGHVNHYVEQNLTEETDSRRISLSFNFF